MVETIFTHPLFVEYVLPFLLMFTIVFAILEKTEILGKEKKQIDAIIALVIGLMFVAFSDASMIVVKMIPILGIALIILLVFMLLFGSAFKPGEFEMSYGLKVVVGILAGLLVIGSILVLTGGIDYVLGLIYSDTSGIFINLILIVVIGGAVAAVLAGKKGESGKKEK